MSDDIQKNNIQPADQQNAQVDEIQELFAEELPETTDFATPASTWGSVGTFGSASTIGSTASTASTGSSASSAG